jgi:glycosyltransferase involved in cell wall biosynthesis
MEGRPRDGDIVTFGVATPTLNAARYLEDALRSVWGQRSDGISVDHVVVDGGSTDATIEIASRFPSRIIAASDNGMYEAINRGLDEVRGDIVGYLNGDDEIAPNAFSTVLRAFERRPDVQWLCGRVEFIDESKRVLGRMKPVRSSVRSYVGLGWSSIPQPTVWFRRSFFERVRPFDTAFKNCADYELYARALGLQHPLILDDVLARFRLHGAQLSSNQEVMDRESRMVRERHGGRGLASRISGRLLSLRLNARNPPWLIAKKTGRIRFTE